MSERCELEGCNNWISAQYYGQGGKAYCSAECAMFAANGISKHYQPEYDE